MAQDIERVQERLRNIRTVKPILGAMRTISLGNWQMAQNRRVDVERYGESLLSILPLVLPYLEGRNDGRRVLLGDRSGLAGALDTAQNYAVRLLSQIPGFSSRARPSEDSAQDERRILLVVLGSDRGLVGNFNDRVAERAVRYLESRTTSADLELVAMGSRLIRMLHRREIELTRSRTLPVTALPPFDMAFEMTQRWLKRYEAYELDAVDVVYNGYERAGKYAPQVTRLIPPELPESFGEGGGEDAEIVVETDPLSIYTRVVQQWTAIEFYRLLLESLASEHSSRFQLMESATQNTEDLVADLTQELQAARRQAITREMQELAAGAGLLGSER